MSSPSLPGYAVAMADRSWQFKLGLLLGTVLVSLLLMEAGLRLVMPGFQLSHADSHFSPRYHHVSREFLSQLRRIQANPAAFRGEVTVAILGDSFVAGDRIDPSLRFTSVMQRACDSSPHPRIKLVNLGQASYSTMLYARLYRDVVLPLDPDVVIVCLDQTDAPDDYLYEKELAPEKGSESAVVSQADFESTILKEYESHPVTFFLLRHSRLFLRAHLVKRRLTGTGFMPENKKGEARDAEKLKLYLDISKDPAGDKALFQNSEKYLREICRLKPERQKLYFVTYPRAENLAGQRKTTLLHGALPDSHASTPYFEYWIKQSDLAGRCTNGVFVHTSENFRTAIVSTGRQYYFHDNDVHWNQFGHQLFADILDQDIVRAAK
jgi:hypothetical protein